MPATNSILAAAIIALCLDLATGTQKWKFKSEGRITHRRGSSGVVYFGSFDGISTP